MARISAAVASAPAESVLKLTTTFAPARASSSAIPLPIPLLAPVTRAVFELSGRVTLAILSGGNSDRGRRQKFHDHRMRPVFGRGQLRLIERGDEEAEAGQLNSSQFTVIA